MLKTIVALLLMAAAAKGDVIDDTRKAFNNCLVEEHNQGITDKRPVPEFNKAAQSACAEEKQKYHDIIVKSEREYGSSVKEAEEYADEETQMIVDSVTRFYSQNFSVNANMTPEE